MEKGSFKEVCEARHLLADGKEWHRAMSERKLWASPRQLRNLFIILLLYCEVANPLRLWELCWQSMSKDILKMRRREFGFPNMELNKEQLEHFTLIEVEQLLRDHERSLTDFKGMPIPDKNIMKELDNSLLHQESQYDLEEELKKHKDLYPSLNTEQKIIYDEVLESVTKGLGKLFFLNGSGGTGKTYVYRMLISWLRSKERIVLPVTSSGIAALLLPGGRTAHSRFKIPLIITEDSVCDIKP